MTRKLIRLLSPILIVACFLSAIPSADAAENTAIITGRVYEFEDDNHYMFSSVEPTGDTTNVETMGNFNITGVFTETNDGSDVPSYVVSSGNLAFSYQFDSKILGAAETEWHLYNDSSRKVNGLTLDSSISTGAIIVTSSCDGETYVVDKQLTDVFCSADNLSGDFYTTKGIQLQNGCFYQVYVIYELAIKTGEKKFAFTTTDVVEKKRCAEFYMFHAVSSETEGTALNASITPRKVLASDPQNTGKDNGYSGNEQIDNDDPHFGWQLGSFVINGYTRETSLNGNTVFLKNVGDRVTLWFTLEQDITCLKGNSDWSIAEDKDGYDQTFGVPQTNFGHGTLIIRFTDYEGVSHEPIVYTNFLEANTRTGADTRVQLFEEGDYEVSLDYEIKNSSRKVAGVSVASTYTDYKIAFTFSIRNGNCMVYPFDTKSGNELSDLAITANGFRLDMAKSRYLNIDVKRSVLKTDSEGLISEDVRFSRPAKDNESYEDEGIYTFTVTNQYTGTTNSKTIYVGTDRYLQALAKNKMSIAEINEKIALGYTIAADGSLSAPVSSRTNPSDKKAEVETKTTSSAGKAKDNTAVSAFSENQQEAEGDKTEKSGSTFWIILVVLLLVAVAAAYYFYQKRRKNGKEE